jgi:hypothetical protein
VKEPVSVGDLSDGYRPTRHTISCASTSTHSRRVRHTTAPSHLLHSRHSPTSWRQTTRCRSSHSSQSSPSLAACETLP